MAIDYASIGLRIKHARNKKKMTQEQLAEALGVMLPRRIIGDGFAAGLAGLYARLLGGILG